MSDSLISLVKDLRKEQSGDEPNASRCREILEALCEHLAHQGAKDQHQIERTLSACQKTFRRLKRKDQHGPWNGLIQLTAKAVEAAKKPQPKSEVGDVNLEDKEAALPSSVSQYLGRLTRQKKDLYKNPPVLPPEAIVIEESQATPPTRNKKTLELSFQSGEKAIKNIKDFRPNVTPEEVLRGGAFGGTYFRSIQSAVTNQRYTASDALNNSLHPSWYKSLDARRVLTSPKYDVSVNKFKSKCGGSLGMWESSGWISDADPYGWFQWYCRFYQGRRCSDDARQIARWKGLAGARGRFKSQLCNKILKSIASGASQSTAIGDVNISPVIRQTLFHWGLLITDAVLDQHQRR